MITLFSCPAYLCVHVNLPVNLQCNIIATLFLFLVFLMCIDIKFCSFSSSLHLSQMSIQDIIVLLHIMSA